MRFEDLLTAADRSGLLRWMNESQTKDLFLRVEHPHGGGSGAWYLIRSLNELDAILASIASWQEFDLDVFREPQLRMSPDLVFYVGVRRNRNQWP